MGKHAKIWLIIAASLVLAGGLLFSAVMAALKWDFTKLSTVKYETNTYELSEEYNAIAVTTATADIVLVPSDNAKSTVVCCERKNERHSVTVKDGTLVIEAVDTRKWYEYIGIDFGSPKITVTVPRGEYGALSVRSSTGDVEIPKDLTFDRVDISESTGDVTCRASVSGRLTVKTSTGDIRVENASAGALDLSVSTGNVTVSGVVCTGDVTVRVSTGKTTLTDVTCNNVRTSGDTGDISLKNVIAADKFSIERSTGDVKLDGCDAAELAIKTDTGDVTGSLLTEKVFIAQADTGRVDVPKTASGGKCTITTDTGDIKITIR